MEIELKDLKINKIRKEIVVEDGTTIKVYNAIAEQRDSLLKELVKLAHECDEKEFTETWYKYLIKNFTNIRIGRIRIRTLLESPSVEFLHVKRCLDEMVNEVYLDMLLAQINSLEQEKLSIYTKHISDKSNGLNTIIDEMRSQEDEH